LAEGFVDREDATSNSNNDSAEWVAIAHILRPQGRKGEVLAERLTDQVDEFRAGRSFRLTKATGKPLMIKLEEAWSPTGKNAGRIVLKLKGYDSISEAETLAGMEVAIPAAELPELEPDTFYVRDLLGCTLVDHGREVGRVVDVQFATSPDGRLRLEDAAPLLVVETANSSAEPLLVPLALAYLKSVDTAAKRISMELPAGLLDMEAESAQDTNENG
jgi:16S rRNA processing protein RimM